MHDEAVTEEESVATPEVLPGDDEATLRPKRLAEFIGQHRVREQLELVLQGATQRGSPPDHASP
jgi:holliday junction DNA helicase RuvB